MKTPRSILIVDDNKDIRDVLNFCLDDIVDQIHLAEDAEHALELLAGGLKPDLILSDIQMPSMSGYEFGSVLAARYPSIPLMFMSGQTPNEEEMSKLSVRMFVRKPFEISFLKACIEDCLNDGRGQRAVA